MNKTKECSHCNGKGLVPIGAGIRGVKACPYCRTFDSVYDSQEEKSSIKQVTSPTELCIEGRAEGDGGCGACALCCKEWREKAEKYELALRRIREWDMLTPYPDNTEPLADGPWARNLIDEALK